MKIKELLERYGLKSRQSIYDWCDAAGIKLKSDEQGVKYANEAAIATLDELQQHIKDGGTLKNFLKPLKTDIIETDTRLDTVHYTSLDSPLDNNVLGELAKLIVETNNPLRHHQLLKQAEEEGWILSTDEVKKLIGTKPKGEHFVRGSWAFARCGKIGSQAGWIVERIG